MVQTAVEEKKDFIKINGIIEITKPHLKKEAAPLPVTQTDETKKEAEKEEKKKQPIIEKDGMQIIPPDVDPTDFQVQRLIKQITSSGATPEGQRKLEQQLIHLIMQMGSDDAFLSRGLNDQRKFAVINELEQVALMHFGYRGEVDGIRYFQWLTDWILNTSPSLAGLGRKQIIQLTAAASGTQKGEFAKKPNILARTFWNRGWKEKAEEEGKVIVE